MNLIPSSPLCTCPGKTFDTRILVSWLPEIRPRQLKLSQSDFWTTRRPWFSYLRFFLRNQTSAAKAALVRFLDKCTVEMKEWGSLWISIHIILSKSLSDFCLLYNHENTRVVPVSCKYGIQMKSWCYFLVLSPGLTSSLQVCSGIHKDDFKNKHYPTSKDL